MASQALAIDDQVPSDEVALTLDVVRGAMPKRQRLNITAGLVQHMNDLVSDPEARNVFRQNVLGFTSVLNDPNVKMRTYLEAVKYVSYKLMGYTNQEAWIKTFPDRYQRLLNDNKSADFIRATVGCYHKGKVVGLLLEQSMIPTWVVNADMYQKAINVQAQLMITAKSEKVRTDAANSLLTHLKQPETVKMKLDVEVKQDDSINELRRAVTDLAIAQKEAIQVGVTDATRIAKAKIISGESERIS